ncbi:MAG: glycerophosphoryl diester phosphodiesterase membrane domain-containing protein [Propionibacteriaceae bacterium]|nr:glycerophosphoryl diester phosphodiesterase membrane domain-containing protein [Propionibacteriaceae bacterium]
MTPPHGNRWWAWARAGRTIAADFWRVLPQFIAYEAVTRLLMGAAILPAFSLVTALLLRSRGEATITNATLGGFLTSWQGIVFVLLLLVLVVWGLIVELGGSITIAARNRDATAPASYGAILRHCVNRARNLLGAGAVLLLIYVLVALPLTGVGLNTSLLDRIAIPQFVSAEIFGTPTLLAAYVAVVVVLGVFAALLSYTFPLIMVNDLAVWPAITTSLRLVRRQPGVWLRRYLAPTVGFGVAVGALVGFWFGFVAVVLHLLNGRDAVLLPVAAFLLLLQQGVALFGSMLVIPFGAQRITDACATALASDPELAALADESPQLPPRTRASLVDRLVNRPGRLGLAFVGGALVLALPLGYAFNDLIAERTQVNLVAHRAGGFAAPENTLAGLAYAVQQRADLVEVDVQRTADGHYVLNHDTTFARVAADDRPASAMTLAEVRALRIQGSDEGVPTLEEFLTAAKAAGMPVIIELKGATADEQMARDVIALAERLEVLDRVVLMSLDYALVQFIEREHSRVITGFAYFLSIGDAGALASDYVLLEEGEATWERLTDITLSGKKSFVWTVNDDATMRRLAVRGADAIITDEVSMARGVLDANARLSSAELLEELLFR